MNDSLYAIPLKTLSGKPTDLGQYKGQVLLIVNVASQCGLTPQYAGLEKLFETYRAQGLQVLGFPATTSPARNRAVPTTSPPSAPPILASSSRCSPSSPSTANPAIRFTPG
jgi:hypothetical protein